MERTETGEPNGPWWDKGIFGALSVLGCALGAVLLNVWIVVLALNAGPNFPESLQAVAVIASGVILPWLPSLFFRFAKSKRALPVSIIFAILVLLASMPCGLLMVL